MRKGAVKNLSIYSSLSIAVFILFSAVPAPLAASEGPGSAGALYLSLPVGPKSISMGEAAAAIEGDPFGWLSNPAMLGESADMGIGVFHSQWLMDSKYDNAFASGNFGRFFSAGLALTYMSHPDVQGFDESGLATGSLGNSNFQAVLGLGINPVRNLRAGINVKYFQEKIADWTASGAGFDAGLVFRFPLPDISLGASVRNVGGNVKFITHEEELPTCFRVGGAYGATLVPGIISVALAADMVMPRHTGSYPALGAEVKLRDIFSIRAGYCGEKEREANGFTVGGGVALMGRIQLDYAWTPYGDLGNFHRVSIFFSR